MRRRDVFGAHVGSEIDGNGQRMIDSATLFSSVVIVFDCIVKFVFCMLVRFCIKSWKLRFLLLGSMLGDTLLSTYSVQLGKCSRVLGVGDVPKQMGLDSPGRR